MDRFIPQLTSKEVYNYKTHFLMKLVNGKEQNVNSVVSEQNQISANSSQERFSSPDILFNNSINHYDSIGIVESDETTVSNPASNPSETDNKLSRHNHSPSNSFYNNHIARSLGLSHWDTRVLKYRNENKLSSRKQNKTKNNHISQDNTPLLINRRDQTRGTW